MKWLAMVILLTVCTAAAPVSSGLAGAAPEGPFGAAAHAVQPVPLFTGGTSAFAGLGIPAAQEEDKKDRLPTGLVAPAVIGLLAYWLIHLAAYAFFGLVLFVFLGLMLLLGVLVMRSRWRGGRALAAVIGVTVAGTAAILLWMVRTFKGG